MNINMFLIGAALVSVAIGLGTFRRNKVEPIQHTLQYKDTTGWSRLPDFSGAQLVDGVLIGKVQSHPQEIIKCFPDGTGTGTGYRDFSEDIKHLCGKSGGSNE